MRVRVCAALVAALLVAADPLDDTKKEKEKLKGTWVVKSFEEEGRSVEVLKGMTFAFDGDRFTSQVVGEKAATGTYSINSTKRLKELDLVVNRPGGGKTTTRAVYVLDGDDLKIYAAPTTLSLDRNGRVVEKIGERPKNTDAKIGARITLAREK